jgi:hypothetical protein
VDSGGSRLAHEEWIGVNLDHTYIKSNEVYPFDYGALPIELIEHFTKIALAFLVDRPVGCRMGT